jgi:hypothetical protein
MILGTPQPTIHKAILGTGGDVIRGPQIDETVAVGERKAGREVVVCGEDLSDNRDLAQRIETAANGNCIEHSPHFSMGPGALFHFQPDPRPPDGHCFFESKTRKSRKAKVSKTP